MESGGILDHLGRLIAAWKEGRLGGATMPEDVHPALPRDSAALLHYFTLGMALNYQRNSYSLWRNCTAAYSDATTQWIFDPLLVMQRDIEDLRVALLKHKVALQPVNHVKIWRRLCQTLAADFGGDARGLLRQANYDIAAIKTYLTAHKPQFPYLNGPKIGNYWLYVLTQYTDFPLHNRAALTVAPDTHVVNASVRLGLVPAEAQPLQVAESWASLLQGIDMDPIDVHTPLWLWSRAGFPNV